MNIKKLMGLGLLIILTSACAHKENPTRQIAADPDYKITKLDSGVEMIEIPATKKTASIGFITSVSGTSFVSRDRQPTDNYETICISRVSSKNPKLMTCIVEKPANDQAINKESKTFTKEEISKAIERFAVKKGFKLASFEFNLDGKVKTEYTTRSFESYDKPEAYMIVRMLSNKDVWSGKPMLYIQEH